MSYLIYLKSAKTNLYRQMVHFDCISTLRKSDRKVKIQLLMKRNLILFFFFAMILNPFEWSSDYQIRPQKVTEVFKLHHEII